MRDGGWHRKTSTNSSNTGWKVAKEQGRERAISEFQKTQTSRLSAPKRKENKYEEELEYCRRTFYGK